MNEHYLGDGLYARYDGFQVWLRAPRSGGDHVVALDPRVLIEFERWLAQIKGHTIEKEYHSDEPEERV